MNAHLGGSDCSGVNERETPQNKKEKKKAKGERNLQYIHFQPSKEVRTDQLVKLFYLL